MVRGSAGPVPVPAPGPAGAATASSGTASTGTASAETGSAPAYLTSSAGAVTSRTEAVLDAIKLAILAGELRPGQSLIETDLADRLGVSKTPVREALKTLAGTGLVTMSPYRGAAVRAVDGDLARSVYDLRLLLEPVAVQRAVSHGSSFAAAGQALRRAAAAADRARRSVANRDFHRALYLGCGNALLVQVLDEIRDQTALVSALAWERAPTWEQEAAEHAAILAAAQAGDAPGAARLLTVHVEAFVARNFPFPDRMGP